MWGGGRCPWGRNARHMVVIKTGGSGGSAFTLAAGLRGCRSLCRAVPAAAARSAALRKSTEGKRRKSRDKKMQDWINPSVNKSSVFLQLDLTRRKCESVSTRPGSNYLTGLGSFPRGGKRWKTLMPLSPSDHHVI